MNILLTNDDGYQSKGLQQLCSALSALPGVDVYVVAPYRNMSCTSHSIKILVPVNFKKLDSYFGAKGAYYCDAMPADCTSFGLSQIGVKIDLVISGPNYGPNYGQDAIYSGTVGAAEEAACHGVRAIALSRDKYGDLPFDNCINFVVENLNSLYEYCLPDTFININVPVGEIKGVVVVPQCTKEVFSQDYTYNADRTAYTLDGESIYDHESNLGKDVAMCHFGYIVLTAMTINTTSEKGNDLLKKIMKF